MEIKKQKKTVHMRFSIFLKLFIYYTFLFLHSFIELKYKYAIFATKIFADFIYRFFEGFRSNWCKKIRALMLKTLRHKTYFTGNCPWWETGLLRFPPAMPAETIDDFWSSLARYAFESTVDIACENIVI